MIRLQGKSPRILVVGDLMIDYYLWGRCERISPEAPVQVVDIERENSVLGGAGNVLNNLLSLGADVSAASVIGDDENGLALLNMLQHAGVNTAMVIREQGRKTSKKTRVVASHQQVVRFDKESKENIALTSESTLLNAINSGIENYDAVLLSDYKKGVLTDNLTHEVIRFAREFNKPILVDPKGQDYRKYRGATLLTPNRKEAIQATGIEITDKDSLREALLMLKTDFDLKASMITLSEDGMAFYENDELTHIHAQAKEVYDVTGAGDTVLATMGFSIACGLSLLESARIANAAAAVVVGKLGSATVGLDEIDHYLKATHHNEIDAKIIPFSRIDEVLAPLRKQEKEIVFTNGCFDILHRGHVSYLQASREEGDLLVVGLNSDASVKRLKGESRPVVNEDDRAYMLAALSMVNYVVIFEEDTPYELIKAVRPNTLTKGADYHGKKVVGDDIAGRVKLIEFVTGRSTTNTITKIKSTC